MAAAVEAWNRRVEAVSTESVGVGLATNQAKGEPNRLLARASVLLEALARPLAAAERAWVPPEVSGHRCAAPLA